MDPKSHEVLELPKVLQRLAGHADFSASKELALALAPTADLDQARRWQSQTTEARLLLSLQTDLTIGGARDVREQAQAAARGVVLEPGELLDVRSTLLATRKQARLFEKRDDSPALKELAAGLEPVPGLIDSISKTLSDRGEVLDDASEKLAGIRRDLQVTRDRLMTKLQRLVGDPNLAKLLQEPIITQREGRYVVPLRAEFKGRLKAVVHDQSSSGATLFVEPLSVVDQNNQLRELELAERDEVRRILAALSGQVGAASAEIAANVLALARLDLAYAKARYAEALDAAEPLLKRRKPTETEPGSILRLMGARHPLLDPEIVVPIDLVLEPGVYALVITGPNTGGKTVSLKTAGLLALMAQCGLHLPVESGSEISSFTAVYADIGDEQSIEQSLSTFSGHVRTIIRILKEVDEGSLVVLDELGAGTDPQEGAALGRAILEQLLSRRSTTLVATHYPELKAFAHTAAGVRNASVEFDLESLRPTYHLTIGLPGRSNALAIAERLGLDPEIIERARVTLAPEDLRAEDLLDEIHRQRDAAREARAEAEQARDEAQALRAELAERLEAIESERRDVLERARETAAEEAEEVRRQLAQLRRRLAAAGQSLDVADTLAEELETVEDAVAEPVARAAPDIDSEELSFHLGDRVRVVRIGSEGVITELGTEEAEVQIGRLRIRARLEELARVGSSGGGETHGPRRAQARSEARPPAAETVAVELDLRGRTIEEALLDLERRLDAAYLASLPYLRIIHGKGTGRLRDAVRAALQDNAYVASFEAGAASEGGQGVTVVRLANQ